ncbi:hypothetical protein ABZV67_13960 [Streptomyces sp. NPDC005065]|uniref:hypothetical protein n=1 Tax=unclassified Streptomyces TaxID=2593676 RepID=UPI0033B6974F
MLLKPHHRLCGRELGARNPFVEFLADELLPWAGRRKALTDDPGRSVVAAGSCSPNASAAAISTRRLAACRPVTRPVLTVRLSAEQS